MVTTDLRGSWSRFWTLFVPHLVVAPLGLFVGVTALHELAHAAAVVAVGGELTEVVVLPSAEGFGHVTWVGPPGADPRVGDIVSVAPYAMWLVVVLLAVGLARRRPLSPHLASTVFLWAYVVPVLDIAINGMSGTDLALPGLLGLAVQAGSLAFLVGAWAYGHRVQRGLFGERSVDLAGYVASTVVLGLAFAAVFAATLVFVV